MVTKQFLKEPHKTGRILIHSADYLYLLPHPALRKWISNYTISFPGVGSMSDNYTVIPHGSATLVFSCDENRIISELFGPITKPASVGREANTFQLLFIVEFQPAGYYAFSGMPQKELTDLVIPYDSINPTLHGQITQQLESAHDMESFIAEVDRLLLAHLKTAFYPQEFACARQMAIDSGGVLSIKELSQAAFYSERHLSRMFDRYLGINMKSFSRLVRVNKALRLLQRPSFGIEQVGLQTGFHDMPHFIHDFKAICGITPQEYRNNMSDFYSEIAKF